MSVCSVLNPLAAEGALSSVQSVALVLPAILGLIGNMKSVLYKG